LEAWGAKGSSSVSGSTLPEGSGVDIWGTADSFQSTHQALTGDGTITARVVSETNTDRGQKPVFMFRETLTAGSKFTAVVIPYNNPAIYRSTGWNRCIRHQHQHGTDQISSLLGPLTRPAMCSRGSISRDGAVWTSVGKYTVIHAAQLRVGLAVTSHSNCC